MGHFKLIYSTLLGGSKLGKVLSALLGTSIATSEMGGGGFLELKVPITVQVWNNVKESSLLRAIGIKHYQL